MPAGELQSLRRSKSVRGKAVANIWKAQLFLRRRGGRMRGQGVRSCLRVFEDLLVIRQSSCGRWEAG